MGVAGGWNHLGRVDTADCRLLVTRKVLPRSHEPIRFACDDVTTNLIGDDLGRNSSVTSDLQSAEYLSAMKPFVVNC